MDNVYWVCKNFLANLNLKSQSLNVKDHPEAPWQNPGVLTFELASTAVVLYRQALHEMSDPVSRRTLLEMAFGKFTLKKMQWGLEYVIDYIDGIVN